MARVDDWRYETVAMRAFERYRLRWLLRSLGSTGSKTRRHGVKSVTDSQKSAVPGKMILIDTTVSLLNSVVLEQIPDRMIKMEMKIVAYPVEQHEGI